MSQYDKITDYVDNHDIYLFGPMGVGKTTFVDNLRRATPVNYVSMGALTREAIENDDPNIKKTIQRGGKVPLDIVKQLISPHIETESSYILDGAPRHLDEAEWIKDHITRRHLGGLALTLTATTKIVLDRIQSRTAQGYRTETPERIAARLDVYNTNQEAILTRLKPALQDVITIDTTRSSPYEVFEEFNRRI